MRYIAQLIVQYAPDWEEDWQVDKDDPPGYFKAIKLMNRPKYLYYTGHYSNMNIALTSPLNNADYIVENGNSWHYGKYKTSSRERFDALWELLEKDGWFIWEIFFATGVGANSYYNTKRALEYIENGY